MEMYRFVTRWHIPARQQVWDVLNEPLRYSAWWLAMLESLDLTPGLKGVGAVTERVTRGRLPYSLRYRTTVTRSEPPHELAYDAVGDLVGDGRFVLSETEGGTEVIWYWNVYTQGFWLNQLAPLLRRLFAWNHNWVMTQGERGLTRWLKEHMPAS